MLQPAARDAERHPARGREGAQAAPRAPEGPGALALSLSRAGVAVQRKCACGAGEGEACACGEEERLAVQRTPDDECAAAALTSRPSTFGETIGPPAEKLYAVDPVGVATMTASAA